MTLYGIKETYAQLLECIENDEIPEEAIQDTLDAVEGEFTEKVDNIACLIKNLKAESEAIKQEYKNLMARNRAKENRIEALTNYLSEALQSTGKTKLETARNKLSFRKSTAVKIANETEFAKKYPEFATYEVKVSKKDVGAVLKDGKALDGAELIQNVKLQVK